MEKSMIYTKTGDKGMTSLVGGQRVSKTDLRLEAYGTVDELNSQLGLLLTEVSDASDHALLNEVQNHLFVVGGYLATDQSTTQLRAQSVVTPAMIESLEKAVDEIDTSLPKLRAFVLPGGTRGASMAHVCRTVCRRAERRILALNNQLKERNEAELDANVLSYMNRLSDFLFVLARKMNIIEGQDEIIWKNPCK
ncbi:MAG: cob(I)yrinic acid a,c-diamide adenosyltransferase [Bacteroidaceae bacterium]|jgi:cob(I)alamin adenosyltransferase|nr:cob(I)yrinic acid a,c-diamide adenosyltransferase [Bacteroidaceae bacterium]